MSINSIGQFGGCFYVSGNTLSEETRRKLLALGIDPNTVTSESEAKRLIENIEQLKAIRKVNNESNSKNTCTDEEELRIKKRNEEAVFSILNMNANVNKFILGL